MNKLIICSECKYSSGDNSSYFCEQFVNTLEDAANNGCTFGKKRITNAEKLKEIFGIDATELKYTRVVLDGDWLQRAYEEPENDRTEEN